MPVKSNHAPPKAWGRWRVAIERFNLDDEVKLEVFVTVIDHFLNH